MVSQLITTIQQTIQGNQFFSGGLLLGTIGGAIALLHRVPGLLWNSFLRRITVTIEVTNQQDAFYWLQVWLAEQGYTKRARRWLITSGKQAEERTEGSSSSSSLERPKDPPVTLAPAPGQHLFRYRGRWIWLGYDREPLQVGGVTLGFLDTMTFRVFGRDQTVARQILQEAYDLFVPRKKGKVTAYVALWGSWRTLDSRTARPVDSLVFDNDLTGWLQRDIEQFQESKQWYLEKGIPYRRGYFLCGPPGNGKSSLVIALAGELEMDIAILPLGGVSSDQSFQDLLLNLPRGSLLLIEDIDKIDFSKPKDSDDNDRLTLSGLLNGIDGVVAKEDRILFMTANDDKELHPALLRPGRIDVRLDLDNASHHQVGEMFSRFYESEDGLEEEFLQLIPTNKISMAALQEHFLRHRDKPRAAIDKIEELLAR